VSTGTTDFEALLREALAPVEPPEDLAARMELTLVNLTELAQEELESWELSSMRDPRNWVRPAAAIVAGSAAGAALVLLRARRREQSSTGPLGVRLPPLDRGAAQRTIKDLGRETRKLFGQR
jgi:hypothetical protein